MNEEPETLAPQGPASAAPAAETLAAILAEMRELAHGFANGELCATARKVRQWVSRIEAASKQEAIDSGLKWTRIGYDERTAEEKRTPGNVAAMSQALERILAIEGYGAPWLEAKCIAQKALEGAQCTPPIAQETAKIEQPGNAAALREALVRLREIANVAFAKRREGVETVNLPQAIWHWCGKALAAPARNCDRFATLDEARKAFQEARGHKVLADVELWDSMEEAGALVRWLFAPMNENGGNKQ